MSSEEFLRRWEAMPDLKHAELIDGVVYMPSPVSPKHGVYHALLSIWLGTYAVYTPGSQSSLETTWVMGKRQVPQPDIALRILPEYGGQSQIERGYFAGAPELITEVAFSSRARDLGIKLQRYQKMGVSEYLVAVVNESKLIWHEHTGKVFERRKPDTGGIYRSRKLPGLWLDEAALWRPDGRRMLEVLQQGIATPEHAAFVSRLAQARK
ncbi:MAG TPA: Uma2 family endonuclease [Terracidiphilus sp.]|nr:Uma2 family endonuclease [Terracidiphilus sp.]